MPGSGARTLVAACVWGALLGASAEEPRYVGGEYRMTGTITIKDSGERRAISGDVIIDQRGTEYRSTYHLRTRVRGENGLVHADVIGRGEGKIAGDELVGTVETQLIVATVPGAYGTAAYVPRRFGPVITQETRGKIDPHGVLTIEAEYTPVEGGPDQASKLWIQGERKRD